MNAYKDVYTKKNTSGFSVVMVLVVIVALAAVAGAGYYVWNKNQKSEQPVTSTSEQDVSKTEDKTKPVLTINTDNWDYESWDVTYPTYLTRNDPVVLVVLENKNIGCNIRGELLSYGEDFKATSLEDMQKREYEAYSQPPKPGIDITTLNTSKITVTTTNGPKEVDAFYYKTKYDKEVYDTIDETLYTKYSVFEKQDEYFKTITVTCPNEDSFSGTDEAVKRIVF